MAASGKGEGGVLLVRRGGRGTYSTAGSTVTEWAAVAPDAVAMTAAAAAMTEAASSGIDVGSFLAHYEECLGQDDKGSQGLHRECLPADVCREIDIDARADMLLRRCADCGL